jgi:hypothetical protein
MLSGQKKLLKAIWAKGVNRKNAYLAAPLCVSHNGGGAFRLLTISFLFVKFN